MTPVAQQSTGRPYRCLPTTSGAAQRRAKVHSDHPQEASRCSRGLTQVLWRSTGILNKPVLQLGQVEVADDDLGVLQAVVVHQVLQLKHGREDGSCSHWVRVFVLKLSNISI